MRITAYVPCHNGEKTLPEVLRALKAQSRPADQYLLINDRSTDRSAAIAQDFGFEVHATGPADFGLAAGRNVALRHARGDILFGVDADAVAEPHCLAALETLFTQRPEIAGVCGNLQEKFTNTFSDLWRSRHMSQNFGDAEMLDPPILFGSSSAHRTEVVRQLGGWNVRFQTNYEDTDLTRRIQAAGLRTLYTPSYRLWHLRRDTLESVLRGFWNWKYPPGEVDGFFASLEIWSAKRLPWIWHEYRTHRVMDRLAPPAALVTCLLPWSILLRDLNQVSRHTRQALDLGAIAVMAKRVFDQSGANPALAHWASEWLRALMAEFPPIDGGPASIAYSLLCDIEVSALQSVPDANYWNAVQSMFSARP